MTAVVQRVDYAKIDIDDNGVLSHEEIGKGIVLLIGVSVEDSEKDVEILAEKCRGMRIFTDENDKMNLSVNDIGGEALIVSNFTLCADTSHGKRPSFINAARPEKSKPLYDMFVNIFREHTPVKTGVFGADMKIEMKNNGPITLILNSKK